MNRHIAENARTGSIEDFHPDESGARLGQRSRMTLEVVRIDDRFAEEPELRRRYRPRQEGKPVGRLDELRGTFGWASVQERPPSGLCYGPVTIVVTWPFVVTVAVTLFGTFETGDPHARPAARPDTKRDTPTASRTASPLRLLRITKTDASSACRELALPPGPVFRNDP